MHRLLELMAEADQSNWSRIADNVIGPDGHRSEIFAEAAAILSSPELSWIFGEGSAAEVSFTAEVEGLDGATVSGAMDRLIITDEEVTVVDYKSNNIIPTTPEEVPLGILRQLGAYHAACERIFPNHAINTAILWTRTAKLMSVPHDIVRSALRSTPSS